MHATKNPAESKVDKQGIHLWDGREQAVKAHVCTLFCIPATSTLNSSVRWHHDSHTVL